MPSQAVAKMQAFTTRHEVLFVMLGATMILVTFIVREGLLERTKGFDSALSQAAFERDVLVPSGRIELGILQVQMQLAQAKINNLEQEETYNEQYLTTFQQSLTLRFAAPARLLHALPFPNPSLEQTQKEVGQSLASVPPMLAQLRSMRNPNDLRKFSPAIANQRMVLGNQIERLQKEAEAKMQVVNAGVIAESERQKAELGRQLDRMTMISYSLFGLGWIVALLGRIFHLPIVTG